ncbi:solute carrier family 45 member 4 isoform X3 [Nothobranchius furzeri]|uniref:solute carrier family 45 member 4 isoform X3 n=1 Tax=Nothobranchius furzeri TaxID=105023 RepID=UPI003904B71F
MKNQSEMGGGALENEALGLHENKKAAEDGGSEKEVDEEEEGKTVRIPRYRWVMHAAVMFGREFCYAMETALVTPVLLQIGLSIGDSPSSQPIGIVLSVVGVVVLDFCADASEGPIRAYLLDVADAEEQDMALNIHGLSAGLGGAVGYMLGGLDWTGTALGRAFKSQEQVLFLFAGVVFIFSVTLHMLSIPERTFASSKKLRDTQGGESSSPLSSGLVGNTNLDVIAEEEAEDKDPHSEEMEMGFLAVDKVRSQSDSVLAMPDASIELDADLHRQRFLPAEHFLSETHGDDVFRPSDPGAEPASPLRELPPVVGGTVAKADLSLRKDPTNGQPSFPQTSSATGDQHERKQDKAANGSSAGVSSSNHSNLIKGHASTKTGNRTADTLVSSRPRRPTFYRQPSFTFSYYGRVGSQRYRPRRTRPPGPRARSLNDLRDIRGHRDFRLSVSSLSSDGSSSEGVPDQGTTVRLLWLSMFKMPKQLWRLCVCHLLTWFSIISEAVFYTDFMGQVIFSGDPTAAANSTELQNYHRGVQMGCWGLVVYAATAAACSAILQKSLDNFDLSVKVIYIVGTLGFSIGTAIMAIFPNLYVAMVMISSMGIISMSISYCPYALLGQYHEIKEYINHSPANTQRGFGIDCAILTCQVYISQILVASALGSVVEAVGSVRVIPVVASGGSFLGFLTACFLVIYPEGEPSSSELDQSCDGLPAEEHPNGEKSREQGLALLNLKRRGNLEMENQTVA